MTRFTDWFSSDWKEAKNVADKVFNFIGKAAPKIGCFIGKGGHIVRNIGNFVSYLPDKLETIGGRQLIISISC
jgi:hypothetical protein